MANLNHLYKVPLEAAIEKGRQRALQTFHAAAKNVPAYKSFLAENGVKPELIKTFDDFQKLPIVTKDNYLRKYPLNELMWFGNQFSGDLISVSSGSTGEPYFWLRDKAQHDEAADIYYEMYRYIFNCDQIPTLLVVCFSMGSWIAGSYTTLGAMNANAKGLKLNILTPALEMQDAIAGIRRLHSDYEQIILAGYPPLLKDLIDKSAEDGLDLKKFKIGFTAAGEQVHEELRDYFIEHGTALNDVTKVVNIYGTVDTGILAHETPLSVVLKRAIYRDNRQVALFGRKIMPTLAQYDPLKKYIEVVDDNIVFTSPTAMPLIRYNIKDTGGIYTDIEQLIADKSGFDADIEGHQINVGQWAKPFVYVHGRSDFTATLYAVLIYPETIKKALFNPRLTSHVTGRFVMSTKNSVNLDQYLEIKVELKPSEKDNPALAENIRDIIIDTLQAENSEYRRLREAIGEKSTPKIILKPAGDQVFFSRRPNKQTWTAKNEEV